MKVVFGIGDQKQVLVRNDNQRIDMLLQLGNARVRRAHPARAFKQERLGYNTNRQDIHFARSFGNDRRSTGTSAAAHASGDKAHMTASERGFDLLDSFFSRGTTNFGTRTCTKPLGDIGPKLDAIFGRRRIQRLRIGIRNDEIDAFDFGTNHIGNCVSASATNADDSNFRLQFVNHWWTDIDAHDFIPLAIIGLLEIFTLLTQKKRRHTPKLTFLHSFLSKILTNCPFYTFK